MGLKISLAVVLVLFVSGLLVLYKDFNPRLYLAGYVSDTRITPTSVPTLEHNEAVERYVDEIVDAQKPLLDLYKPELVTLSNDEHWLFLMNAFTPLGIFDPFQFPDEQVDVKGLSNFLLGYYSWESRFNFDIDEVQALVNRTIYYGHEGFEADSFFIENHEQFSALVESMEFLDDVYIVADFGSGLSRYNNFYGDSRLGEFWYVPQTNENFNGEITFLSDETLSLAKELTDIVVRSEPVHRIMLDLDVESVYKCDEKIILIIAGISNNALGYVYNAGNAGEVNCGILSDRFRISKEVSVGERWTYWVGK